MGRVKYTLQLIKDLRRDMEEIKLMQRTICAGLKGLFNFQKPMIQRIACGDEVDAEILEILYEGGSRGVLPKDVSARLGSYGVRRHQVTRRIQRMNRRMEKEIGERLVEKRGWHWALTASGSRCGVRRKKMKSRRSHKGVPLSRCKYCKKWIPNIFHKYHETVQCLETRRRRGVPWLNLPRVQPAPPRPRDPLQKRLFEVAGVSRD